MNKQVYLLTDYKGYFGSKAEATPYRSGMDIKMLMDRFKYHGFDTQVLNFSEVNLREDKWKDSFVIYTSQEDPNYFYKDFIEDIAFALELKGAHIVPSYKLLRANNNKVFMELLRDVVNKKSLNTIETSCYGCYEEYKKYNTSTQEKRVFKEPRGAKSRGVFLSDSLQSADKIAQKISRIPMRLSGLRDKIRTLRHKGYIKDSQNRQKFIVQNFIPDLENDWKVLVFGDKYFIEYRGVRKNDFRASGSQDFKFDKEIENSIPEGIFELAEEVRNTFDAPHFSLDFAFVNGIFYMFEFQALYFSSYAFKYSQNYYERQGEGFVKKESNFSLEELYVDSLIQYIEQKYI